MGNRSDFLKKRWQENREEMLAIARKASHTPKKKKRILSEDTKRKIAETLKRKGCAPPWELSPMGCKGHKKADILGQEIADKMSRTTSLYNKTRLLSQDTRLKMSLAKQGRRNYNWKGGITSKRQQEYNTLETKTWRRAVFSRDKYTCQECGKTRSYLNAHHIKEMSKFPELRLDVNNGATLCLICHKKTANYGGKWVRERVV